MKTFISILALVSTVLAFAQSPVITVNNVYLIGDEVPISICNEGVEQGASGENITWDMSNLTELEEQSFSFVAPEDTPWDYQFTESNLCGVSWDDSHSFYQVGASGLRVDGYTSYSDEAQTDTVKIIMADAEELIPLPLEFGDTQLDQFSGTTFAAGFTIPFDGEIEFEADGFGTLILPNGSYENVVRYHFTREQVNTVMGISTTQTKEQWGWMSADYRFWLLLMEINDDGFSEQELVWYAKNPIPVSLSAHDLSRKGLDIFPNPAQLGTEVAVNMEYAVNATVQWYDITGRKIHQSSQFLNEGQNTLSTSEIDLAGVYILNLALDDGTQYSTKVLLE